MDVQWGCVNVSFLCYLFHLYPARVTVAGVVGFIHWRHTSNGVGVFWTMLDVGMVAMAMAMIGQQFTLTHYKGLEFIFL